MTTHRAIPTISRSPHLRLQDKAASYIDRMRNLENENARLSIEVDKTRGKATRETTYIKSRYANELSNARRRLDDTIREKTKLEIDMKRLSEENEVLRTKLERKAEECMNAENNALIYESRACDLSDKFSAANVDHKRVLNELENNIQSLRKELTIKDQMHTLKIEEMRSLHKVEISEINGRLFEEYEDKIQKLLQELREHYEEEMRTNREARIRAQEQLLDNERRHHKADLDSLQAELQCMRDEMALQLKEYEDLMKIKVSLDMEIAAYDKLIGGEESRFNIRPSNASLVSLSALGQSLGFTRIGIAAGPFKRKRITVEEQDDDHLGQSQYFVTGNAKCDIQIAEADSEGKFVKLQNKGPKEIQIGGWQLMRSVSGGKKISFKFHRTGKIDAGNSITVWSSNAGVTHKPPTNIVMKTQKWFVGDKMKTLLFNSDGVEVAGSERIKRSTTVDCAGDGINGESAYHQQNRPQHGEEKCVLM